MFNCIYCNLFTIKALTPRHDVYHQRPQITFGEFAPS